MAQSRTLRRATLATIAAFSLLGAGTGVLVPTALPTAEAQVSPSLLGPGYVDIVGRDYNETTATWSASVRPFTSASAPYEHQVNQRIVIPKTVGEPRLDNARYRAPFRGDDQITAFPDVKFASEVGAIEAAADTDARNAALAGVSEKLANEPLLLSPYLLGYDSANSRFQGEAMLLDGLGGKSWTFDYGDGLARGYEGEFNDPSLPPLFLKDHEGNVVKILTVAPATSAADAPVRVTYQVVPQDVIDSVVPGDLDYPFQLDPAASTNFDRVVYEAVFHPADVTTGDQLPAPTATYPAESADVERYVRASNALLAAELGLTDPGALTMDMAGGLYGTMVLPKESQPINAVLRERSPNPPAIDEQILYYSVSESDPVDGQSRYWYIDVQGPAAQFEFDIVADKLPVLEGEIADEYVAAQIYHSETCTRWDNDLNWQCQDLLEYSWARGENLESTQTAPGESGNPVEKVRGSLVITEDPADALLDDAARDRLYQRGIFGNDRCLVTRPTENPNDYSLLASTILPSDLNTRFPGQKENNVSSTNRFISASPFSDDIQMRGANEGTPFSFMDGCDQAGVRLTPPAEKPTEPGDGSSEGSALIGGSVLIGGSALLGSALLSSGSSGSAVPDGSSGPSTQDNSSTGTPGAPGSATATPSPVEPGAPGQPGQPGQPAAPAQTTLPAQPPAGTSPAAAAPTEQAQPRGLAQTGAEVTGAVAVALLAMVSGAALLVLRRRRG